MKCNLLGRGISVMPDNEKPPEEQLNPGRHGTQCCHNGENPSFEIACDECDFFLLCFPDWKEFMETV